MLLADEIDGVWVGFAYYFWLLIRTSIFVK